MPYEVVCGECSEMILIEDLGVEVHCPHCNTVLMLTEEDLAGLSSASSIQRASSSGVGSAILEPPPASSTRLERASDDDSSVHSEPDEAPVAAPANAPKATDSAPNFNFSGLPAEPSGILPAFMTPAASTGEVPSFGGTTPAPNAGTGTPAPTPVAAIEARPAYSRRSSDVSRIVFISLISYSIFTTLALLYLLVQSRSAQPHQLESLPDIKPAEQGKYVFYRSNATLAPGHTLALGESQRFGNLRITPLRVTRGALTFEHFQGLPNKSLPPSEPVWKLWLKIENVSNDQEFAPFDLDLLTLRRYDEKDANRVHSNNWVCTREAFESQTGRVWMYPHPSTSEYDIRGLVTRPLKPGESIETFIPTQEQGLDRLQGSLIWRFQVRKGLNADTRNGVTTLVEVTFDSSALEGDRS